MNEYKIVDITPENAYEETFFCIKNIKSPAFKNKFDWFKKRFQEGLKIKILKDQSDKAIAFIEYVPAQYAWRPVNATNFMFIHCMYVYSNKDKGKGIGSKLISLCEKDAQQKKLDGVCVMTSKGSWVTDKRLFENNGYEEFDKRGRFELMVKKFNNNSVDPQLIDWTLNQDKYKGWHLLYSDQCPWHEKSVKAIINAAKEYGIEIKIQKITTSEQARNAPSGFGVFSLLYNGKLLEDHYISETRFKNILKKELQ